jgi:hypothetical protein
VSEHSCQGDWEANCSKGNSSLWQICPRVSGLSDFLIFCQEEEATRVKEARTCEENRKDNHM